MLADLPPAVAAALADAPLALVLLWMLVQLRRDVAARPEEPAAAAAEAARAELDAFKLEVARTYVPLSLIRDLDSRLTQQLGRLEAKLDEVSRAATAAAAVSGHALPGRAIGFGLRAGEPEA
ncbi:hypothetical protein [Falsiroseomonas oryzae]|uniref:hypothetical protein n=1 Tax=Falsiroseomonas oryzae TaxID=2766473 RepID=UPI0022EA7AB5|nr:hypothetical protein [Roseomonas sp. MO-31]